MNPLFSSRIVLGIAAATTSLVLMAGCDRKPGDTPASMSNDRTAPPAVQETPASPMPPSGSPSTPGMPPASDPATPTAPAMPTTPSPGGSGTPGTGTGTGTGGTTQ